MKQLTDETLSKPANMEGSECFEMSFNDVPCN